MTTFNTVFGRYWLLRLPLVLKSVQDEFQRKVDNVLILGRNKDEHDKNLRAMLQRSREQGVKLNPEKSMICATGVSYFRHRITKDGIEPDPAKIVAEKQTKTKVSWKLSLAKVCPHALRHQCTYAAQHDEAFRKLKELITREPGPVLA